MTTKSLYTIVFSLVILNCLFGQADSNIQFRIGEFSVLSTTGLNMRSAPNLKSKVLTSVPFNQQVEVLDTIDYGRDTIGIHILWNFYDSSTYEMPIVGNWRKVKYQEQTGYMFGAYLIKTFNQSVYYLDERLSELKDDYALLGIGQDCFGNFYYNPNWYWYGFYESSSGYVVKPVEVSFFIDGNSEFFPHITSTNDNKGLREIIGTKKKLNLKRVYNKVDTEDRRIFVMQGGVDTFRNDFLEKYNLSYQTVWHKDKKHVEKVNLFLHQNGKKQLLNPDKWSLVFINSPMYLNWVGDIDGDGKDDYIISYGDKNNATVLYLSSEAEEGQIVKPVAIMKGGYCC